jgi:hypothetical protein
LLTIAVVVAMAVGFQYVFEWIDQRAVSLDRIQAMTNQLVRTQLIAEPVMALTVASVHTRKTRFTLYSDRWAVEGEVILEPSDDGTERREPYTAVVHTICDDPLNSQCWVLERLSYGDRTIKLDDTKRSVIN